MEPQDLADALLNVFFIVLMLSAAAVIIVSTWDWWQRRRIDRIDAQRYIPKPDLEELGGKDVE